MAVTDWEAAKLFSNDYPKTFSALQGLVHSTSVLRKNTGKTSFFGKDKGLAAAERFSFKLKLAVEAMIDEKIMTDSCFDFCKEENRIAFLKIIERFSTVFPNWQEEYVMLFLLLGDDCNSCNSIMIETMGKVQVAHFLKRMELST